MNIFSNKFINSVTLILTVIIFFIINFFINSFNSVSYENKNNIEKIKEISFKEISNQEKDSLNSEYDWYIEIPSINLKAPIKETTEMNVLNEAVGHFEDTDLELGNIGLAAHNRGYKVNYFQELKNIKKKDEIIYNYNEFNKTYIVDTIEIIKNTNWSYLENTSINKITLITCTENNPEYRLCVQATEK